MKSSTMAVKHLTVCAGGALLCLFAITLAHAPADQIPIKRSLTTTASPVDQSANGSALSADDLEELGPPSTAARDLPSV